MSELLRIEAWRPWKGEIFIHPGETFDPVLEWSDDDGALDWTDYQASLEITWSGGSSLTLSTADGGMTLGADGSMGFWMTHEQTAALVGRGAFRLFLTQPDGKVRLFGQGTAQAG